MYFKLSRFFLILSLFAIPIVSISTLFPFIVGKYSWFRASVDFGLLFFALGLLFSKEKDFYGERAIRVLKSPLGIAVGVFVAVFLLAGFLGFDPANSFWSNFERGEGGAQVLHLYAFFVLLTALFATEEKWRKILGFMILSGFLMAAYGVMANLGFSNFVGSSKGVALFAQRFEGSVGNAAYVSVFSLFLLFYVAYLLVSADKKKLKKNFIETGLMIIAGLVFLAVFYLAGTRGAFLGLIGSLILSMGYAMFFHGRFRKLLLILTVIVVLSVGSLIYFRENPFVKNLPGSRIFDISISATTFGHRTIMWGIALEGFKERPILGWGPENFYQVFDRYFDVKYFKPPEAFGAWFDRAHSLIFDYLAETGILGLTSFAAIFIVFYALFFSYAVRSRHAEKSSEGRGRFTAGPLRLLNNSAILQGLFLAAPAAYLIQGLVLFDVLVTYINLFLFLAFANYHFLSYQHKSAEISANQR